MLKKLSIAAACGLALCGLAKVLRHHVVVALDGTATPFEATAGSDPCEVIVDHGAVRADDAAAELPPGVVASEQNPPIGVEASAAQAADPVRDSSWP